MAIQPITNPDSAVGADMATYPMPRCCVENLGCRVNRTESDWMEEGLSQLGCPLVTRQDAQVVVINTCAVTGEAQAKTRKAVRRACEEPGVDLVAVTGCVVNLFPDEMLAISPKVRVLPAKLDVARDVAALWRTLHSQAGVSLSADSDPQAAAAPLNAGASPASAVAPADVVADSTTLTDVSAREGTPVPADNVNVDDDGLAHSDSSRHLLSRLRRGVKVQDGCNNRCTYCIVWKARGTSRSVALDQIDDQIDVVLGEGACEIDLTGVNLGTFRTQDTNPLGFAGLVDRVARRIKGHAMLRASSVEPQDIDLDVLQVMADLPDIVCPHLHLPLQSGSDRTLERMGRSYHASDFARIANQARQTVPGFSLTTDVIVGFPGETDQEFEESLAFCSSMGFSRMHVFRYSERPGTPAADMPNKVDPALARARSERMRALARAMRYRDAAGRVGTRELALVERPSMNGKPARGTTASYHDVLVDNPDGSPVVPGLYHVQFDDVCDDGALLAHAIGYVRLVGSPSI